MKSYLKEIGVILLGAFILCIPVFYNGYPILCYDSGTYIKSGFSGIVPIDRPLGYGLFVRHTSMSFSLWFTVYAQCIILSGVLFLLLKNFINKVERFNFCFSIIIIGLTFFSNIGWCAGQIMADIFAPIFMISFICLLFIDKLTVANFVFLILTFVLSCVTHYTHLLMTLVVSFALIIFFPFIKKIIGENILPFKRVLLVLSLSVVSLLTCLTINYSHEQGGGFRMSRSGHVFIMAHLVQTGVLEEFLNENCTKPEFKNCKMCLYKDSLGHSLEEFLWHGQTLSKTGGWYESEKEYNFIITKMFSDFNFAIKNIYESFRYGITELFLTKVGDDIHPLNRDTPPGGQIDKYFHDELNAFLTSKQNVEPYLNKKLDTVNDYNSFLLVISACIILYYLLYKKNRNKEYILGLLIVCFVVLNAFVTAGLNAPYPRFQSRIAWLILLFVAVIILNNKTYIIKKYKKLISNT